MKKHTIQEWAVFTGMSVRLVSREKALDSIAFYDRDDEGRTERIAVLEVKKALTEGSEVRPSEVYMPDGTVEAEKIRF